MKLNSSDELKRGYRLAVIIGIAMIASLFIYAAIVEICKHKSFRGANLPSGMERLRYVLYGLAGV